MPDPIAPASRPRPLILLWAILASVAAFIFANTSLLLWLKLRDANERLSAEAAATPAAQDATAAASSPFARLQDSEVAGRYHLFHEGTNVGVVALLPNHSILNKDGETLPQYHWEIQPLGLMTRWQRGRIFFDVQVNPGVYVSRSKDGREYRRLEKLEEQ